MADRAFSEKPPIASLKLLAQILALMVLISGLSVSGLVPGLIQHTDAAAIEAENSPPSVSMPDYTAVRVLTNWTFTANCTDADPADHLRLTWYWGDESVTVINCNSTGGSFNCSAAHIYVLKMVYTVTIWIDDLTGLSEHNVSDTSYVCVVDIPTSPPTIVIFAVDVPAPFVGDLVTYTVLATDPDSPILGMTLDLGDGTYEFANLTQGTLWTVEHTYETWGYFDVMVQVTDYEWHPVTVEDTIYMEVTPCSFSLDLVPGWNMVTVPLSGWGYKANTLGLSFGDVITPWDGPFQIYGQAFIVGLSPPQTAFTIEDGEGYWIYVSVAKTLTLYGRIPTGTQNISCNVPAEGGWAMIGFTGLNASRNASDLPLMYSIPSGITMVACYDAHTLTYQSYLSLFPKTDFVIPVGAALFCFCTSGGYLAYVP